MRPLQANESKLLGLFGLAGACLLIAAFLPMPHLRQQFPFLIFPALAFFPLLHMAWFGLRARPVFIDGDDLIEIRKRKFIRTPIADITSVRTWPYAYHLSVLQLKQPGTHGGSTIIHTIVRDQDLTWIMSRMPHRSITPYWQRRVG